MSLLKRGLVEKHGKTSGTRYILSKGYYEFVGNETEYVKQSGAMSHQAISAITAYLFENKKAKMKDFSVLLEGYMTRRQVKSLVDKLVEEKMLTQNGKGIGTYYEIGEAILDGSKIIAKAIDIGLDELRRRGELQ
jgi:ATP-dependent DNA helicase RecG